MSTITVNTINPYFISGSVNLNGIPVRNNTLGTIIGIGSQAAENAIGASNNSVAIGKSALQQATTGYNNTALGNGALQSCTGYENTGLGRNAGFLSTTGYNNIFIGSGVYGSTVTASNEITLGNTAHTVLRCQVTSITSLSDGRDKKDVEELPVGLSFIETLKPVKFVWNDRDENGKHDIKDFGFIAQDLKSAQEDAGVDDILKLVYEENPDRLEASYGKLVPILVKAIQELSGKVKMLENK